MEHHRQRELPAVDGDATAHAGSSGSGNGPRMHWAAAVMIWLGSWVSGFFIIVTNAWMQRPVAYTLHGGKAQLDSFWGLLTNPWVDWQYAHNMSGAALSGAYEPADAPSAPYAGARIQRSRR